MRTKRKAAALAEQQLARERAEAYDDARALALELARGDPSSLFDPMAAGVVLEPGERAYRQVPVWVGVQHEGRWAEPIGADVVLTDARLLCRFGSGRLSSLWWSGVVGLHIDLVAEHVVLDYGDGEPVGLSGMHVGRIAVVGIAAVYGVEALVRHPSLRSLRTPSPGRR